jgi:hypothetical protein
MSDPLKDASLEEAQKDIRRRLLREGKLKRIAEQKMRRAAATDWRPAVKSAAASGPSVHDAADAIEEADRRRRAHMQEARRWAEEPDAADQSPFRHDVILHPDATLMQSKVVDIAYSKNLNSVTVHDNKPQSLQANWYGGGSFTVVMTVPHTRVSTTDMPMWVETSGSIDGMDTDDLSMNIEGQVVHMEGLIKPAKFSVDEDGQAQVLVVHAENSSGFDVEVGLEVNGVRQVPLRLPVEGPSYRD